MNHQQRSRDKMRASMRWASFGLSLCLVASNAAGRAAPSSGSEATVSPRVDGELALEQRLVAPCCWVQTLDVHDSPLAKELRTEIHARLVRGDTPSAIEADLVARFGERIVAMPASNPLAKTAAVVGGLTLLVGLIVIQSLRRWKRAGAAQARGEGAAGPTAPLQEPPTVGRDKWDDRLDDELKDS